jgi:hypothetical protein
MNYPALFDLIGDRVRSSSWTPADAMACGAKLQERFIREHGRPLSAEPHWSDSITAEQAAEQEAEFEKYRAARVAEEAAFATIMDDARDLRF